MKFPENLRYTREHEWISLNSGVATIGVTEFAVQELGEIVFVDLPAIAKSLRAGETVCVVESTKAASDVYAPLAGTVKEVNAELAASPDLVNNSPYEKGWLVRLEGVSESEVSALMDAAAYAKFINSSSED